MQANAVLLVVLVRKIVRRVAQIVLVTVDPGASDFDRIRIANDATSRAVFELVTRQ